MIFGGLLSLFENSPAHVVVDDSVQPLLVELASVADREVGYLHRLVHFWSLIGVHGDHRQSEHCQGQAEWKFLKKKKRQVHL